MGETTAIATRAAQSVNIYDRMTDPLAAIERMGAWLAKSKMLGIETPEQGAVVAMTCMQEGITPLEFKRRYHVIKGTPSMRADYMQAEYQAHGGRIRWDRTDDDVCTATFFHAEHAPNGFAVTVDRAELKRRGVATAMYDKYPRQMLRARAISEGVRAVMPAINAGHYTAEELDASENTEWAAPVNVEAPKPQPKGKANGNGKRPVLASDKQVERLRTLMADERLPEEARDGIARLLSGEATADLAQKFIIRCDELLSAIEAETQRQGRIPGEEG